MDFGLIRFHKYKSSDITLGLKKITPRHQSKYSPDQLYNRQNPANNDDTLFFSVNLTPSLSPRNERRHLTMIPYATIEEAETSRDSRQFGSNTPPQGWFDRYKIQPKVKNSFSDHVSLLQRRHEDVHPRYNSFLILRSRFV
uniref:Uncharacterized protein n=1 Tax=Brassica oleracea TaxID=3712 RepID=A0A3P6F3Q0_BRAOL|nr:unnamed protein product [Brassica oleracea]